MQNSLNLFINYLNNSTPLSEEEQSIILSKLKYRKYLKGQFIAQQGDTCKYLNFVVSGSTKTFHTDNNGKEYIFRFAIEKWWATDLPSFLTKNEANTSVQCIENTEVIQISKESLDELYLKVPILEHFFRILFQKVSISLEKRIIAILSESAKDRYLTFLEEYPTFEQRIPQYMIASYLGISKQYLSEIRNQIVSS